MADIWYHMNYRPKKACRQCLWTSLGKIADIFDQENASSYLGVSHGSFTIVWSFLIIWHFMSYDAYDIEIWHKSIWLILVSKRPSGPQQSHPFIRFWLQNCLKTSLGWAVPSSGEARASKANCTFNCGRLPLKHQKIMVVFHLPKMEIGFQLPSNWGFFH